MELLRIEFHRKNQLRQQEDTVFDLEVRLREVLKDAVGKVSSDGGKNEAESMNLLIASGITRFGILFVVAFIMNLLVNLYRYTMRLSAYYLAQSDAMLLASSNNEALLKVLPALSPTQVDFGKQLATPFEQLSKMADFVRKSKDT